MANYKRESVDRNAASIPGPGEYPVDAVTAVGRKPALAKYRTPAGGIIGKDERFRSRVEVLVRALLPASLTVWGPALTFVVF
jgi:hypothetical protein